MRFDETKDRAVVELERGDYALRVDGQLGKAGAPALPDQLDGVSIAALFLKARFREVSPRLHVTQPEPPAAVGRRDQLPFPLRLKVIVDLDDVPDLLRVRFENGASLKAAPVRDEVLLGLVEEQIHAEVSGLHPKPRRLLERRGPCVERIACGRDESRATRRRDR